MAKRRKTRTASRTTSITKRVGPSTINVRVPAAVQRVGSRVKRHRAHYGSGGSPWEYAIGGAALGWLDKIAEEKSLPTLPIIGRAGTIGLIAYFVRGQGGLGGWAAKIARAGFTVAGYQYLRHGKVEGDDSVMGDMSTVGAFSTV